MTVSLERLWVSFIDSPAWRRFAKGDVGSVVLRSTAFRKLNMARRYASTYYKSRRDPMQFQAVKTCCIFIGHTKCGSSLLGSLLDAHPNAIIADGADALQFVAAGFSKEQFFHVLLKVSRREAMKGRVTARRLTPYSFQVPNQWQGRYQTLEVIGDTTSETAVRRYARDPTLLSRLQQMMGDVDLKFVHVIRNPYDPISIMMVRGKRTFENAVERYFATCDMLVKMRSSIDSANLFPVKYEDVVYRPEVNLRRVCGFLGMDVADGYLADCLDILRASPDKSRGMVAWDPARIDVVQRKIEQFDFLQGYTFDD